MSPVSLRGENFICAIASGSQRLCTCSNDSNALAFLHTPKHSCDEARTSEAVSLSFLGDTLRCCWRTSTVLLSAFVLATTLPSCTSPCSPGCAVASALAADARACNGRAKPLLRVAASIELAVGKRRKVYLCALQQLSLARCEATSRRKSTGIFWTEEKEQTPLFLVITAWKRE